MTYKQGKANAREEAQEYQRTTQTQAMSWGEVATWCDHFYKLAKRYRLIKEFKENGII